MRPTLESHLNADRIDSAVADAIRAMARAAVEVAGTIREGGRDVALGAAEGEANAGGDMQKALDVIADRAFVRAAQESPIAFFGSEEQDGAVTLDATRPLALAIDPLDGSSNIATNVSIGTIFSLLPVREGHRADPESVFRQFGREQTAAGFFIYGPQLLLVVTWGMGTQIFLHSPEDGGFVELAVSVGLPETAKEFAINAANARHWGAGVSRYVSDCQAGADGPRGRDFSMRWVGSMVADAYRILTKGGIFLYPGDARPGYAEGRLRLLYEANPVAFCIEQAGGRATDGTTRILDLEAHDLHQRTPVVFGSREEVDTLAGYLQPAAQG